jgi:hypothetical protein
VERFGRRPAAVSASKAAVETARNRSAAATSARETLPRGPLETGAGAARPVSGEYRGMTGGRFPEAVEFRFLGSGIRDLTVGGRLAARWVPVGSQGGSAIVGSTRVKLAWTGEREVSGWIQRGRGSRTERVRFTAAHRFAGV